MYDQTKEDLLAHLKEHIYFIDSSCHAYDKGFSHEAKRIAVSIRILLHDTRNSRSLLSQLNMKDSMLFYDTALDYNPRNLLPTLGLVMPKLGFGPDTDSGFIPPLDDGPPHRYKNGKILFEPWWNKIVLTDGAGKKWTRKDLVLIISNKDGGAHVDPKLDKIYANITRHSSLYTFQSTGKLNVTTPELPSIRQIGHEVLKSLKDEFPEHF